MLDADPRRRRVVHAHQHRERLDAVGVLAVKRAVAVVAGLRAAHAGADEDAGASPRVVDLAFAVVVGREHHARIGERAVRGDDGELADAVEHAQLRWLEVLGAVELDGRGQRSQQSMGERHVEAMDRRTPRARGLEHLFNTVAERRDEPHAGDGHPPHDIGAVGSEATPAGAPCWAASNSSM